MGFFLIFALKSCNVLAFFKQNGFKLKEVVFAPPPRILPNFLIEHIFRIKQLLIDFFNLSFTKLKIYSS